MFKRNEKGQMGMEFILTILFILSAFILGVIIFESRISFNQAKEVAWDAESVAQRASRNINQTYLLNDGAVVSDYLYWIGPEKSVILGKNSLVLLYSGGLIDVPILAETELRVSDFNGLIYFEKSDGKVIVRN